MSRPRISLPGQLRTDGALDSLLGSNAALTACKLLKPEFGYQ